MRGDSLHNVRVKTNELLNQFASDVDTTESHNNNTRYWFPCDCIPRLRGEFILHGFHIIPESLQSLEKNTGQETIQHDNPVLQSIWIALCLTWQPIYYVPLSGT